MKKVIDDLPRDLGYKEYEYSQARFEAVCNDVGIKSVRIGYFGNISCPGVSDIDAVVVGRPLQILKLERKFEEECNSDPILRKTFWHRPVYLIDEILEDANILHSMYNVQFISGTCNPNIMRPDDDSMECLHMVWWSFLIIVVMGIYRSRLVPLRLLLLIHKNLETSEHYFASLNDVNSKMERKSEKLRGKVINSDFIDEAYILDEFWLQFRSTCLAFDQFCAPTEDNKNTNGLRPFFPNRSTVLFAKKITTLNQLGGFKFVGVPNGLIKIGEGFIGLINGNNKILEYSEASRRVARIYQEKELSYPFITPFAISLSKSRLRMIKIINACVRTFTFGASER
ncbi:MAG: hypothetical protein D8M57_16215 [Candidatus Scalindua sp. AMX11]|nr:MAG: hypothetical protein DWQ00_06980 [Candidatus Scalindua sp.]NOG82935.1 hypothetical protein [Planctomycetota bacterium]RZV68761.1 MAG: hypothetical protein EX341_16520 [Candidatus Scalindua sp. SCAELEC01]TDE63812.1 MAG: hypothetical protein D8M57_16215 [Candidatus Scalindua sp. AMX11]